MAASYKKLWKLLIDKDMKKKDLIEKAGVTACMTGCAYLFNFRKQGIHIAVSSQGMHILEMTAGKAFHPDFFPAP